MSDLLIDRQCVLDGNAVLQHALGPCRGRVSAGMVRGKAMSGIVHLCAWHRALAQQRGGQVPLSRFEAEEAAWRIALKVQAAVEENGGYGTGEMETANDSA